MAPLDEMVEFYHEDELVERFKVSDYGDYYSVEIRYRKNAPNAKEYVDKMSDCFNQLLVNYSKK